MASTVLEKVLPQSATAQQFQSTRNCLAVVSHAYNKHICFKGKFSGTVQPQQQLENSSKKIQLGNSLSCSGKLKELQRSAFGTVLYELTHLECYVNRIGVTRGRCLKEAAMAESLCLWASILCSFLSTPDALCI